MRVEESSKKIENRSLLHLLAMVTGSENDLLCLTPQMNPELLLMGCATEHSVARGGDGDEK